MSLEELIIAAMRVATALPVLRWPFYGALIAIAGDQSDLLLMNLLDLGGVGDYQSFDKYLDQVYLLTFLVVALRWSGPARTISIGLYLYRLVGFVAFELTGERSLLLFFPNLFEYWYLLVAALHQFRPGLEPLRRPAVFVLPALLVLKLGQEYAIHYARLLDGFTTVEALQAVWRWLASPF